MSWPLLVNESHCLLFYERNSDRIILQSTNPQHN
ncbi:hypothetical protein HAP32_03281 [Serratia fonticola]|nr:hypothetical protein HAP32_03281 [Serratia fonticola]